MDKFGIFKVLTSFYDFYQKNKGESNTEKKQESSSSFPFNLDFLSKKPQDNVSQVQTNKKTNQKLVKNFFITLSQ